MWRANLIGGPATNQSSQPAPYSLAASQPAGQPNTQLSLSEVRLCILEYSAKYVNWDLMSGEITLMNLHFMVLHVETISLNHIPRSSGLDGCNYWILFCRRFSSWKLHLLPTSAVWEAVIRIQGHGSHCKLWFSIENVAPLQFKEQLQIMRILWIRLGAFWITSMYIQ